MDDVLERTPVFRQLHDADRQALAQRMSWQTAPRGNVFFQEGERGDTVHVLLGGKVKISRTSGDGRENLLAVLGPGDIFGELSLFDPGPRTASAVALTDVDVGTLSHDELRPWIAEHPRAATLLLQVLARRLRRTNEAMADLVFTDVPGRVAKALLDLADRFGADGPGGVRVDHGLTQEELAHLVGASRETVNKALADFSRRRWLSIDGRAVVLLDPERLRHRAR